MIKVNFGINRRVSVSPGSRRSRIEHKNGTRRFRLAWDAPNTPSIIRARILAENPGWNLTGYALAPGKKRRHVYMVQLRFVPNIIAGTKRTTIRLPRKRMPRAGDVADLRHWIGKPYRSKQIAIGDYEIKSVTDFTIEISGDFCISGLLLALNARDEIACADGFKDAGEMVAWFKATHGLPFSGFITEWRA